MLGVWDFRDFRDWGFVIQDFVIRDSAFRDFDFRYYFSNFVPKSFLNLRLAFVSFGSGNFWARARIPVLRRCFSKCVVWKASWKTLVFNQFLFYESECSCILHYCLPYDYSLHHRCSVQIINNKYSTMKRSHTHSINSTWPFKSHITPLY